MRSLILLLTMVFFVLQYRLWVGDGSRAEIYLLQEEIATRQSELKKLQQQNLALAAEVQDLKKGLDAIEERARNELGMIKQDEVFYQVIAQP
ncbi:MAG: cell division protein FtsB [gamma proteobacterium symbiont of Bathyaustriella thionipta]|nr:cell division protein FtsB [gamma proteobacterium symbiont of Bathyaustriella thionipta]